VLACAQKISGLACLTMKKLKMNRRVPNKNADLLKKISLTGTETRIALFSRLIASYSLPSLVILFLSLTI